MRQVIASILLAFSLAACAQVQISLPPYTPVTTDEMSGTINVRDFIYSPKQGVSQNEIRETAAGRVLITENVGVFFSNAVRREFRQAGLSLKDGRCSLEGEIFDFAIDSLGFSSDYITDVRYVLRDPGTAVAFEGRRQVKFNASKFVQAQVIFANINKAVADNVGLLMKDPAFVTSLTNKCSSKPS